MIRLSALRSVSSLLTRTFTSSSNLAAKNRTWNMTRLNHVAVAVPDLAKATALFRDVLGAKVSEPEDQVEHGVTTVFVELANAKIELLHPLGDKSPIANFLAKNKAGGIHHICVDVDNVKEAIKDMTDKGVRTLSKEPSTGAHGYPVVFLHPKDMNGVLTEFEEPDEEWKKTHAKK